jgi:hypothetical protein
VPESNDVETVPAHRLRYRIITRADDVNAWFNLFAPRAMFVWQVGSVCVRGEA